MINPRRVFQLAKKWQMVAALGRRRLTAVAGTKDGHCVVYTAEGARFEVPLGYLGTTVFSELLRMSEDEFGFAAGEGRITLPCDAAVMEYVMGMLRRKPSEEVERAVLSTVVMPLPCNHESSMAMAPKGITQSIAIF